MNITPEIIEALRLLRMNVQCDNELRPVFNLLDNAGVFAEIDEATGYDVDPAPERVSKCTCPPRISQHEDDHYRGCPGDPAEWGDMAFTAELFDSVQPFRRPR